MRGRLFLSHSLPLNFLPFKCSILFRPVCINGKGLPCLKTTGGLTLGSKWTCHRWGWGVLLTTGGKTPSSLLQHQQLPHHQRWPVEKAGQKQGCWPETEWIRHPSNREPQKTICLTYPNPSQPMSLVQCSACRKGKRTGDGKSHIVKMLCKS